MNIKRYTAAFLAVTIGLNFMPVYALGTETPIAQDDAALITQEDFVIDPTAQETSVATLYATSSTKTIAEIVAMHLLYGDAAWGSSTYTYEIEPDMDSDGGYTDAGLLSAQSLQEGLDTLKMVRYLADVPYENITFSDSANLGAQQASYAMALNNTMSHYPTYPSGMDTALYNSAYAAASASNIASGYSTPASSILGWIKDGGSSNINSVGHRRWLLAESSTTYGLGAAKGSNGYTYSAAYVKEGYSSTVTADYVAWPTAGAFPIQYFVNEWSDWETETATTPWSISLGTAYDAAVLANINIALTRTTAAGIKTTWQINSDTATTGDYSGTTTMHLSADNTIYGMKNTITFRPDLDTIGAIADGDVFTVTITGLTKNGTESPLTYEVDFFDLESAIEEYAVRHTVTFNITDENGNPISDASIQLTSGLGNVTEYATATGTTGEYTADLKENTVHTYFVTQDGYVTATGTVNVESTGQTVTIPMTTAAYTLTLTVYRGTSGEGVAGAAVTIDEATYYTNENGQVTYYAQTMPDSIDYSISMSGYSSKTGTVTCTGTTQSESVQLSARSYLYFVVTNEGTAVSGATIQIGTSTPNTTGSAGTKTLYYTSNRGYTYTYTVSYGDLSVTSTLQITGSTPESQTFYIDLTYGILNTVTALDLTSLIPAPVSGATPVTSIETDQYTATITWSDNPSTFAASTEYIAAVTLNAKTYTDGSQSYTLNGIAANSFTHADAFYIGNAANSSVVNIIFAETDPTPTLESIAVTTAPTTTKYAIGDSFDPTGMVITATYTDGSTTTITDYTHNGSALPLGDSVAVTITYQGKTTTQLLEVIEPLSEDDVRAILTKLMQTSADVSIQDAIYAARFVR